ncbi:sulfotransferase [Desulfonatronum thiosulfatophilum]|uniref:sulfotransferase n=1 Tax=Desulfonatronum thiosulfatophilum TaxID=617002 RepID=UPI000B815AD8
MRKIKRYKSALDRWAKHIIRALNVQTKLPDNSYINIKYEDLVKNPDTVISNICDFLQVKHYKTTHHANVHKESLSKWKEEFTKDDLDYAKIHYSELFKIIGYEL